MLKDNLPYFSDHKAHLKFLIFSKVERGPYSPVRPMCGSGCALSRSFEQILCCNKRYKRNSTYLDSFFVDGKLLLSFFLAIKFLLSFPLRVCFLFLKYKYGTDKMR